MSSKSHITTGELAAELGEPIWKVRRAVDALGVEIPRFGPYRLIPRTLAGLIRTALGKAPAVETTAGEVAHV